jgi:hypothetical protein
MMRPHLSRITFIAILALFAAGQTRAADAASVTYRRVFKSSVPEFIEIHVPERGDCRFDIRQLDEDAEPQTFQVGDSLRGKIFELTGQLNDFRSLDLDVKRRIANLGQKTFRWERGTETHEVTFNYTLNATANQLMQIFEGLARQQEHLTLLERRYKYDRLGLNDALMQFEIDLNKRAIPEPQRLLSILEVIGGDPKVVDLARQRARNLAERIRNPKGD